MGRASADGPPTQQSIDVHDMLVAEIDENLAALKKIFDEDVAGFNNAVSSQNVPAIFVDE